MQQRAYSIFHVKSIDAEQRVIEGMATTPTPDRVGDVIEPKGVKVNGSIPLLLHHDTRLPVGTVKLHKATDDGIGFTARIPQIDEPGTLKDRVDEAWQSVKAGLIKGVSVGFRVLDDGVELLRSGGVRFTATEVLELSLVAVPANAEATIASIKSFDTTPAVAGSPATTPAVAGTSRVVTTTRTDTRMKTIAERKQAFVAEKAAKVAKMNELMSGEDAGATLDEAHQQEFDTLDADVKTIDAHLVRLETLEKANIAAAVPVAGADPAAAAASRDGQPHRVSVRDTLPPGIGFARSVKAFLVAKLDRRNPLDVAKEMYPSDDRLHKHVSHVQMLPNIIAQLKAAVPAATTTNSLWAGALVDPTNLPGEFIEFLRPATIIGRLNLRSIPTNVRLIEQTQGGTGYWVGQGAPKPLTAFGYAPITLSPTKVAAIAVASEESLRFSTPSLDQLIRDGLRDALVERVDQDLLDPSQAGTANVQPASLTNGLTALASAGPSADNIRTDLANIVQAFRAANLRGPIVLVMPDSLAVAAAFMATSLGTPEFPELNADGGSIRGIRVITSQYMANVSGSGNMIAAIAEREVFMSDDGGVRVDASSEASLQMLDNPTNNSATATATQMVSMWQTNSVAFRGEWFINWQKRRTDAVVLMDDVNWGSIGSP